MISDESVTVRIARLLNTYRTVLQFTYVSSKIQKLVMAKGSPAPPRLGKALSRGNEPTCVNNLSWIYKFIYLIF